MHLIDIREPNGPYWAAYQAERACEGIIDDPGFVPEWFLTKLARERLAAARVALEQLSPVPSHPLAEQRREVWDAIKTIESFLSHGDNTVGQREQVLAGLLGAQEIETERERRDYEASPSL